jgi:hypothetical protein
MWPWQESSHLSTLKWVWWCFVTSFYYSPNHTVIFFQHIYVNCLTFSFIKLSLEDRINDW